MLNVKDNQLTCSDKTTECMDVYINFLTINLITWNQWLLSYGFEKGFWNEVCVVWCLESAVINSECSYICSLESCFLSLWLIVPYYSVICLFKGQVFGYTITIRLMNMWTTYPPVFLWICKNALLKPFSLLLILGTHLISIKYYTI
jgi:hypothetical protein